MSRIALARPLAGGPVAVTIDGGLGNRGPWTYVLDGPRPNTDMIGPPPAYLALAAWAA